jgi:hypothetical protein
MVENPRPGLSLPESVEETSKASRATSVETVSASSPGRPVRATQGNGRKLKLSPAARRMIHHHLGLPRP